MAVEQHGFDFGQHVVVTVQVRPPRLHHSNARIGEVIDCATQEVGGRHKVGVEHSDELAGRVCEAFLQGPGFEAMAIRAVAVFDVISLRLPLRHKRFRKRVCLVSRVVEHLHLQQLARVIHLERLLNEALHHVLFVVQRQLDGDAGQLLPARGRAVLELAPVFQITPDHLVAVHAEHGEDNEHAEVR
jgi:hypothetical protein